jgi:hypothetical protein
MTWCFCCRSLLPLPHAGESLEGWLRVASSTSLTRVATGIAFVGFRPNEIWVVNQGRVRHRLEQWRTGAEVYHLPPVPIARRLDGGGDTNFSASRGPRI